jgi:hypothetical protein
VRPGIGIRLGALRREQEDLRAIRHVDGRLDRDIPEGALAGISGIGRDRYRSDQQQCPGGEHGADAGKAAGTHETPRTLRVSHFEGSVSSLAPLDGLATVLKRRAGGNRLAPMPPYRSHTVRLLTGKRKLNNDWGI